MVIGPAVPGARDAALHEMVVAPPAAGASVQLQPAPLAEGEVKPAASVTEMLGPAAVDGPALAGVSVYEMAALTATLAADAVSLSERSASAVTTVLTLAVASAGLGLAELLV